jgi:hypothetical protein
MRTIQSFSIWMIFLLLRSSYATVLQGTSVQYCVLGTRLRFLIEIKTTCRRFVRYFHSFFFFAHLISHPSSLIFHLITCLIALFSRFHLRNIKASYNECHISKHSISTTYQSSSTCTLDITSKSFLGRFVLVVINKSPCALLS